MERRGGGEKGLGENSRIMRFRQSREPPEETEREEVRDGEVR